MYGALFFIVVLFMFIVVVLFSTDFFLSEFICPDVVVKTQWPLCLEIAIYKFGIYTSHFRGCRLQELNEVGIA